MALSLLYKDFTNHKWDGNNVLLFGSEGYGLKYQTLKNSDFLLKIAINEKIESEFSLLFYFATKKDWGKYDMSEGHYFPVTFEFEDSSRAMVACFDWNKKSGIKDNLKVSLYTAEYRKYLKKQKQ